MHKIWQLQKSLYKMSTGSGVSPGSRTGAAAETVQAWQKTVQKKLCNKKRMCLKLSAEVAMANFKQKNKRL